MEQQLEYGPMLIHGVLIVGNGTTFMYSQQRAFRSLTMASLGWFDSGYMSILQS